MFSERPRPCRALVHLTIAMPSSQVVDDQPAEQEKDHHPTPEDPFILLRSPLHHTYGITTNTQGICNSVKPPLCALEHIPLLAQVAEHSPPSV